ncbi:OmpA family protein [Shewanella livingstonensis]|uniref:OmpA family protein n=1 Tax=Shewanella livingstonensis TaxID=150120 RepID=A0A3G8LWH2_9GAMM|nr:OmpA family protein [Shewanella livingstonensis]AZG74133.1 OmpA family protein [Shewanella livingstonensis]
MKIKPIAVAVAVVFSLTSCVSTDPLKKNKETLIGCAIGTGLGALLGNYIAGKDGIAYGAAAGAAIGCTIGYDVQKKREALEALAKAENLNIQYASISTSTAEDSPSSIFINSTDNTVTGEDAEKYADYQDVGMAATISSNDDTMFVSGSAIATNKAKVQFQKLSEIYKDSSANILITGHTDSSGSEELNQSLSEQRARYVAQIFSEAGIAPERLYFQGAGESQPVAANRAESGKAQNRRVEVIEIVGKPEQLLAYSSKQKSNLAYLSRRSQDRVNSVAAPAKETTRSSSGSQTPQIDLAKVSQAQVKKLVKPTSLKVPSVDFGGTEMTQIASNFAYLVGERKQDSFALFSKAYASEISNLNCAAEGPRVDGEVKSLATGDRYQKSDYNTGDYLPGMNGTVWVEKVNGHYIGLTPVAVISNGGAAVTAPVINIWKDFDSGKTQDTPSYQVNSSIETYYGETGLLYRVFSTDRNAPVRCMDIVMPIDKTAKAIAGKLYYEKNKTVYEANFEPKLL